MKYNKIKKTRLNFMGARTVVKTTKKAAKSVLKEPKAVAKAAIKSATKSESRLVMIGALAAPLVNTGYSYLYNAIIARIPFLTAQPIIAQIVKIAAPLVPAWIFQQFRIPFGNLVNGCLYGITGAQIINLIVGLFTGAVAPAKPVIEAAEMEIAEPILPWEK